MRPVRFKSPFEHAEEAFKGMLFRCNVPYEATRTTENVKMYGTYLSGNSLVDGDIHTRPTTVYISCERMLELFRKGIQIRVLDYTDTKLIYNTLQTYLLAWKEKLTASFNIRLDDPDLFIKMDELATAVYDHAEPIFANDEVKNLFLARASNLTRYSGTNFFKDSVVREIQNKSGGKYGRDGDDFVTGGRSRLPDSEQDKDSRRKSNRASLTDHFKEILAARKGMNS